ncbi:EAL domain-containing protein [Dyella flava]|uniref:EAL domain-containing protein n=1 Tax=Dyella flava TaxID=1920170 RepID=A0ABS2K0U9_9GAMM|nr:EAL domain-containing protein [Dyella flava]MBM7124734.1 EAL domain-containing protein [Dyella flava]GLQ50779.1 hypothetical protein GCM10010872_22280 [Dyella flava]
MTSNRAKHHGVEILIAEDSPTQAERVRYTLEENGFAVTITGNGKQALKAARQRKPALIISDVMMPEMDGFTLCSELRRDEQLQHIPVILLTTLSDVSDIMCGLKCGADNFIRKPYEDSYLLARVDYLLMTNELRRSQKINMGVEIYLGGEKHFITAERQQIVDLLISVYEEAVHLSSALRVRERELTDSNCTLAGLYHVAEGLNGAMSEREVCERALENAMFLPGVQAGWIYLLNDDKTFRLGATRNLPQPLLNTCATRDMCECQRRFLDRNQDCPTNMQACERLAQAGGNGQCHAIVPLWSGGENLGILNLAAAEPEPFKDSELGTFNGLGHQVAIALERANLHEHLERLVEERTAALTAEVAERKRAELRFHNLFEYAPDAVVMIGTDGNIALVNRQAESMFAYPRAELLGKPVEKLLPDILQQAHMDLAKRNMPRAMGAGSTDLLGVRKDGTRFPVDISLSPLEADGSPMAAVAVRDVTERKEAERKIARLNRLYAVLSGINTTIVRVHERKRLFERACRIAVELGKFSLAWVGMFDANTWTVTPVVCEGHEDGCRFVLDLSAAKDSSAQDLSRVHALLQKQPVICNNLASKESLLPLGVEAWARGYRSSAMFPLLMQGAFVGVLGFYASEAHVFDAQEKRLLTEIAHDISFAMSHLQNKDRLNYLAFYDAVTDLPNRMLFLDRVGQKVKAARHERKRFSVIMFDLIRFSRVNESLGRQAGDDLLREFTRRVQEVLGETDVLARFSADTFGLATHYDDEGVTVMQLLDEVFSVIQSQPFQIGGQELSMSVRAGVASYPTDGMDADALWDNAESALKNAQVSGNKYMFYAPSFNVMVTKKLSLESKLRRAVEHEQLVLHYQPAIDIQTGRINGLEALIRWEDPDHGLVLPLSFIPLLEETGMIMQVGEWALKKAVSDAVAWQAKGFGPMKVAVNVSTVQLHDRGFVGLIEHVVKDNGDVAYALELEITESLVMKDIVSNIQKLRVIRQMGVSVAIDDFGTGYSSLSYIAKLPANTLKIDRMFVMNMASSAEDQSIVSTIISLAHSLDMRVVAEGVETDEQARLLRMLKCDEVQGFLYSPAVPAQEVEALLFEHRTLLPGGIEQAPSNSRRLT